MILTENEEKKLKKEGTSRFLLDGIVYFVYSEDIFKEIQDNVIKQLAPDELVKKYNKNG